jgi:alkylation response protein AidB-like acyl-CoA dehydrogenase
MSTRECPTRQRAVHLIATGRAGPVAIAGSADSSDKGKATMGEFSEPANSLVARAREVAAVAAGSAVMGETQRCLDPDVVKSIVDAGFARYFVPARVGGTEGTFAELTRAVVAVGRGCSATAWCASLIANLGRMASYLPADCWKEVWADGPDTVVVGSLTPSGTAEPVAGGWQVSGRWPYISAVSFADWALVAAQVPGSDRKAARVFAVPRSAFEILDTWNTVGMQATGSNTVVVDGVFVPATRSFARDDLFRGRAVDSTAPPHTVPRPAVNGLSFATPVLGAARGALDAWLTAVATRLRNAVPGAPGLSRTTYDVTFARAAGEIDAAELLLERASALGDRGGDVTELEVAQNLRDCSLAVDMLVTAVDRLFRTAGTSGQAATSPIQRFWRDVNSAASHVALLFEPAATAYAGHLIDVTETTGPSRP